MLRPLLRLDRLLGGSRKSDAGPVDAETASPCLRFPFRQRGLRISWSGNSAGPYHPRHHISAPQPSGRREFRRQPAYSIRLFTRKTTPSSEKEFHHENHATSRRSLPRCQHLPAYISFYADRTPRSNRHHRHSGSSAPACAEQSHGTGAGHLLRLQPQGERHCHDHLFRRFGFVCNRPAGQRPQQLGTGSGRVQLPEKP